MDSENSKSSVGFVGVECLIIAIIAGIYKQSFVYGAAAFILVMVLYEIPVVSGVASVWMSMIDAIIAGGLLSMVTSQNVSCIVSVFSFAMFITAHRNFSVISDDRIFGYSFIISECILNSLMLWYASSSIILACIVFAILIILMFTPILRVLELIALTVWTTIEVYSLLGVTLGSAEKNIY